VQYGPGDEKQSNSIELSAEPGGYFSGFADKAQAGMLYRYRLASGSYPDPASRFQPEGPHGPSQIVDAWKFKWHDQDWKGVKPQKQVIYEMHVGTFTRAGTWAAAKDELSELAKLGITVVEVMPVAEFPGRFGWGYDGVDLFAPSRLYGQPDDFRQFVDEAHLLGLGVILDVVYNHFGPDGNYLKEFSEDYFTDRYHNEWGEAINFDAARCQPVREFFCANAAYWIEEFHLDGLRLDATQQMVDSSGEHILAAVGQRARRAAGNRATFIAAENEPQDVTLVHPLNSNGYGLDALWNDDFHHAALVALSGRADAYYSDYKGSPQELISVIKRSFLYQGQRSTWQKKPRGSPTFGLPPECFITFLENHDQVANSLHGLRVHQLTSPGRLRALTALLLLGPGTPMLFQGQEFAASTPFLYFADHQLEISRFVEQGRKKFLSQFKAIANHEGQAHLPSPHSSETFLRCKLDPAERTKNAHIYEMHRDLLRLRREDPVFSQPDAGAVDGAVLGPEAFVIRFFHKAAADRLLLINLGSDLQLAPLSEPLLAAPNAHDWGLVWSSESPRYGGNGTPDSGRESGWLIPGHGALVLAAAPYGRESASTPNPRHHGHVDPPDRS
jgi:maltooligosyltrehalose trehalohydrolase